MHDGQGTLVSAGVERMEIQDQARTPETYALYQNYPNPFNGSTAIRYQLPVTAQVKLTVYNILGEQIVTLVKGNQPAGYYTEFYHASDQKNNEASGLYFVNLQVHGQDGSIFSGVRKMLLLK